MPDSESFDAFYARTVWNVTSQMHALAGGDGVADHAIREAYARAYQQWYEISGFRDSEAWVLNVAKTAYERRLQEAAPGTWEATPTPGHDPLTSPGMFRPRPAQAQPTADPEATMTGHRRGAGGTAVPGSDTPAGSAPDSAGSVAAGPAGGSAPAGLFGSSVLANSAGVEPAPVGFFGSPGPGSPDPGSPVPTSAGPTSAGPTSAGPTSAVPTSAVPTSSAPTSSEQGDFGPAVFEPAGFEPADRAGGDPAPDGLFGSRAPGGLFGSSAPGGPMSTASLPDHAAGATTPGQRAGRLNQPPGAFRIAGLSSRRSLIAVATSVAVVLVAVVGYVTLGGRSSGRSPSPGRSAGAVAKPTVHMLPAHRTGNRAAIPWTLIGPGWTLAELSTAQPDVDGAAAGGGSYTTYLVDPEGGKYRIQTTSGASAPELLAWSGNAETALFRTSATAPGYGLLTLASGQMTSLSLPAGVTPVGFTRPHGLDILAVRQGQAKYRLERYNLAGAYQATLGSLPRPASAPDGLLGNALSSPDGTTAVWGVSGEEMQLVSNAGGLLRKLHVPDSGKPPSCTPVSWWDTGTVLAYCAVSGQTDADRLWLVPDNGSSPTALTGVSGSPAGIGDVAAAWHAGGRTYITSSSGSQCPSAASGPGGLGILRLGQGQSESPVSIPDTTNNHSTVVAGVGSQLLVLAQTSCPGTSSLVWFDPAKGTAETVLTAPATEVGVIAAVPFGPGPTAVTAGQS